MALVFDGLNCTCQLIILTGFFLIKQGDGRCRYYYPHENNTLMQPSKLVATKEGLTKIKKMLMNVIVTELCTAVQTNTKWKVQILTKMILFNVLLKEIHRDLKMLFCQKQGPKNS